jgi:hypothetical protein
MKKVFALLAVLVLTAVCFGADSLDVKDTAISVSQVIIPAHIDSVLPFNGGKTIYVPARYNRKDRFTIDYWNQDSLKLIRWVQFLPKNSAFQLPANQKFVYQIKFKALRVDSSFACPDPYLP